MMAPIASSALLLLLGADPLSAFNMPSLLNPRSSALKLTSRPHLSKTEARFLMVDTPEADVQEGFESSQTPTAPAPMGTNKEGKGKINNMFNEKGVAYAPWMVDSLASSADVAAAEKARQERKQREGNQIFGDVQAQEMAGTGLTSQLLGDEVSLKWSTGDETDNVGYIVQKRRAGAKNWEVIQSYETYQPLATKGTSGGVYEFVDPTSEPGSWYYRIMDCDDTGKEDFVCQSLVEIQTNEEKFGTLIAVGVIGVIMTAATVVGLTLDPQ